MPWTERQLDQLQSAIAEIAGLQSGERRYAPPVEDEALKNVIGEIRDAQLRDFSTNLRPRYQVLHEALTAGGIPVAALSVCGRGTREIRFTQLLGYFLGPKNPHGLGSRILKAFLVPEGEDVSHAVKKADWHDALVHTEFNLGRIAAKPNEPSSTIDFVIHVGDLVVLIEHKIKSPESGSAQKKETSQLRRYSEAFDENFPDLAKLTVRKLFLTPNGREPRDDPGWTPLSYGSVIQRLATVLDDESLSGLARHNLAALLWDLMSGPLDLGDRELTEMIDRLAAALDDPMKSIPLGAWCRKNVPHLDVMLKTVESCHG